MNHNHCWLRKFNFCLISQIWTMLIHESVLLKRMLILQLALTERPLLHVKKANNSREQFKKIGIEPATIPRGPGE
jgi:hypothetical protein